MKPIRTRLFHLLLLGAAFALDACGSGPAGDANTTGPAAVRAAREWREYLGGPDRNHYSALAQITVQNVHKLEVAWEYHTLDTGEMQCNPIVVDGVLYGMSAATRPFAIDAATGEERWRIRDEEGGKFSNIRGLTYWEDGSDRRILYTNGPWLYAVNAENGEPIASFGAQGRVSLKAGLGNTAADKSVISTTPGTVFEDLIIMPMRLSEAFDAAPGYIQAFDIRTGRLAWVFHTIPRPGEFGYDTWPAEAHRNIMVGGANNWAGMAVDRKRGIVYIPTGSAADDFYGGHRKGTNLFANCLLALDARTGKRIWHYQLVHHDILDRDAPAPPNLVTVRRKGKKVDAVAQITKQGLIFLFDRETGEPLFPIEERPVPASDIPGESAWPTQPFPVKPSPFARQDFREEDISPYAENREELIAVYRRSRYEGPFTPLTKRGTIIFPGLDGGAEWGGAAVDPDGILYVNSNEMPWLISLDTVLSQEAMAKLSPGQRLYMANCSACHGTDRRGNPSSGFPSLVGLRERGRPSYILNVIANGKGMMPAFQKLSEKEWQTLTDFLLSGEETVSAEPASGQPGRDPVVEKGTEAAKPVEQSAGQAAAGEVQAPHFPYRISGYTKFLDKNGYPAIRPPWGTLNAIDLNTGEYIWKIPYGEHPELVEKGIPPTGTESYGGPVVTAGGILFIAGTKDRKFRAYDKRNGKLLWETELPAAAFATPSTYEAGGRQYIVVACGGTKLGAEGGDSYVAFALPEQDPDVRKGY